MTASSHLHLMLMLVHLHVLPTPMISCSCVGELQAIQLPRGGMLLSDSRTSHPLIHLLCVSVQILLSFALQYPCAHTLQLASIGALLDHMVRERALTDLDDKGIGGLDIRDIELLSLSVLHKC